MAREKYRLEPLVRVRQIGVEKATASLGLAEKARREATVSKGRAQAEIERAELAAQTIRDGARPATESISAADLAIVDAWETREQKERGERSSRLKDAEERERREVAREDVARAQVEKSRAEAQVALRDREKWAIREQRKDELMQEERANEQWAKRSE